MLEYNIRKNIILFGFKYMLEKLIDILQFHHLLLFFIGVFISAICTCKMKKYYAHKRYDIKKDFEKCAFNYSFLSELRNKYDASRVFIYLIHNGEAIYNNSHIQRASCVCEIVKNGVSYECQRSQNIPLTYNPELIKLLKENNNEFVIVNELNDCFLKNYLEIRKVYSVIYKSIILDGKIIGYIGMHFCEDNIESYIKTKNSDIYKDIEETSIILSQIFNKQKDI